jgi:hypothetical protein
VTAPSCKHDWVRYVLDDSAPSHAQQDGLDEQGRPYRDLPMLPKQAFAYAATIGSTFASRVVDATCRDCGLSIIVGQPHEVTS